MRVTIVPSDGLITVDGESFTNIDMSSVDSSIHAVQWYETYGEIEIKDPITKKMISNVSIDNLDLFSGIIQQFNEKKAEFQAALDELQSIEQV